MKLKISNIHLSGRPLICVALLFTIFVSFPVIATTEMDAESATPQSLEVDLKGYAPDQKEWSKKAIAGYEKQKSRDGLPIAMLTIERLNIEAPVYFGTDRVTLDRGLGLIDGNAYPDEVGNIAISGHRDGFFRPLKDIKLGDMIEMQTPVGVQSFEVSDISIVDALEVSVLDPTDTTVLTLITCHPFYYQGYAPDRYIVRATPFASGVNGSN